MSISTNYDNYYYYSQNQYPFSSISNAQFSTESADSSQSKSNAFSSSISKKSATSSSGNIMNLSASGMMIKNSLQKQVADSSDFSDKMEAIKADMDSIKTADIDTMSVEDLRTALTNLQNDIKAMPSPDGSTTDIQNADIANMSESDMKKMLEEIQEQVNSAPPPPMEGGFEIQDDNSSEELSKVKEDLDSIKSLDIDSMTADDMKTLLTTLQTDMMAAFGSTDSSTTSTSTEEATDIADMTEAEMRKLLEEIQEQANSAPPPPPMGGGFDVSQILDAISGSQSSTSSMTSGDDTESIAQQLINKLTESYDGSTESKADYVAKLKEALESMFSQQKSSIDDLSSSLLDKLETWSSDKNSSAQTV